MVGDQLGASIPSHRILFLGASNLARGYRPIVDEARNAFRDPLDIIFALGHGRSYGCASNVLGRQLPAIVSCRIWSELSRRPTVPTTAFITDIGNDILYMRSPDTVIQWVATIVERLTAINAKIVVSTLPLDSLGKLRPAKFYLLRSVLFPRSTLTFADAQRRVSELDRLLRRLATQYGATLFGHDPTCYGFDPIHVRRGKIRAAWRQAMALVAAGDNPSLDISQDRLPRPRPRYRRLWGVTQRRRQPLIQLASGTTISVY